jgi:HEAT repeat protein
MAYEALVRVCEAEEEDCDVRRRALEALAYTGTDEVVRLITRAYEHPEERMRVSAVFAMGRSADPRWSRCVRQELSSPNPELRFEGARASGELALSDAVADLVELTEDVDGEVQEAAVWALGQIGGSRAKQVLERVRQDGTAPLRAAAQDALAEFEFLHGELSEIFDRLLDAS